jgi:hypothetical protein
MIMKKQNDAKSCYGKFASRNQCKNCIYKVSCELYTRTDPGINGRLGLVSFDNTVSEWYVDPDARIPGEEELPPNLREEMISSLGRLLKWLMSLDGYTLGLVAEMIAPTRTDPGGVSVAYLAKLRGCTRQSVHEKMVDSVLRFPELSTLFQTALRRMSSLKCKFEECVRKKNSY